MATLVIGEVSIFTWFMPNFIADAPIQPEKTLPAFVLNSARSAFLKTLRAPEAFPRVLIWNDPHSGIRSATGRWIA
jgi:hypothetical protein